VLFGSIEGPTTTDYADITDNPIKHFLFGLAPSRGDGYTVRMIACLSRLLMIAALGLLLAACNHQAPAPTPKTDLDRLQGTWNLVSAMQDGKALPEDKVKQTTIVFKGDTFRFPGSAEYATSKAGTIKLDESKTPKEMDAISTDKEVMLGIYTLQENGYKVCFAPAGKPRPAEFTSTPGSGYILQSWERTKNE
jgi:uncharacterized protein (TIGR03067 family)